MKAESGSYFFSHLLEQTPMAEREILLHSKYEIDKKLFFFGKHNQNTFETSEIGKKYSFFKASAAYFLRSLKSTLRGGLKQPGVIFNNAYFGIQTEIQNLGFPTASPPWVRLCDLRSDSRLLGKGVIRHNYLSDISGLSVYGKHQFFESIREIKQLLKIYFLRHRALALAIPSDTPFFESLSCEIFREIRRPSFLFLHGLPAYYTVEFYNRKSDYLVVWGSKIKKLFLKAGADPKRLLISGHPLYSRRTAPVHLRSTLDSVLVISKSYSGVSSNYLPILSDRSALLTYLNLIRVTLKSLGMTRAKLRVHPSENMAWYRKNLMDDFFYLDDETLGESLQQATLVIGPTSTTFIDAVFSGVAYFIFEPIKNGKDLLNFPVAPPFDGTDARIPVAGDTQSLANLLKKKPKINPGFIADYISPEFNLQTFQTAMES